MIVRFELNGAAVRAEAEPAERAVDLLRSLGALCVKEGCGTGECGACSVLVDGAHKLSCLLLAAQLEGRSVVTAEGLGALAGEASRPHPVQTAMAEHGAVQCGYCSPGMAVAGAALLAADGNPSRQDIRRGISGNLCRCTGYAMIVDAVQAAAAELRGDTPGKSGGGADGEGVDA